MDVGQLANQAVRDLTTRLSGVAGADPDADPLGACFALLAGADGWGKLALQRVCRDPQDPRAASDLRRSLEQAARLHPRLAHELEVALGNRVTKTDVSDRSGRLSTNR